MERFFTIQAEGERISATKYSKKRDAEYDAKNLANLLNKKVTVLEVCYCSEKEPLDTNLEINSYEKALEYLGYDNNVSMCGMILDHKAAMMAMYKLIVIAEAWNKADNFIPNFDNEDQLKWNPEFKKPNIMGFTFECTNITATFSYIGSRLCFKTKERAEQFGEQFIALWNDLLL